MLTRTISGFIFILIVIGALMGGFISSILLFAIISFFGTLEFYKLSSKFAKPYRYYGASFSSTIVMVSGVIAYNHSLYWIIGALVIYIVRFVILLLKSRSKTAITDISTTIAGALYLAIPFVSLLHLGILDTFNPESFIWQIPLTIFILTWVNDTGAYLSGRTFGKHKLFERISPKKTWEGSIGGLLFTLLGTVVIFQFWPSYTLPIWIGVGVLVSIFSNLGDLMESAFKRNANQKDSGTIMPGHGGILDRFDAILLTAPVVLAYLLSVAAI